MSSERRARAEGLNSESKDIEKAEFRTMLPEITNSKLHRVRCCSCAPFRGSRRWRADGRAAERAGVGGAGRGARGRGRAARGVLAHEDTRRGTMPFFSGA